MKVVINSCHGGFGLSAEGKELYLKLTGTEFDEYAPECNRAEPELVQVVETLGEGADDRYAQLKVVEIPDNVDWDIQEYDGLEWVAEKHRTWR